MCVCHYHTVFLNRSQQMNCCKHGCFLSPSFVSVVSLSGLSTSLLLKVLLFQICSFNVTRHDNTAPVPVFSHSASSQGRMECEWEDDWYWRCRRLWYSEVHGGGGSLRRHEMIEVAYDKRIGYETRPLKGIYFCSCPKGSFINQTYIYMYIIMLVFQLQTPTTELKGISGISHDVNHLSIFLEVKTLERHSNVKTNLSSFTFTLCCSCPQHCWSSALHSPLIFQSSPVSDKGERQSPLHLSKTPAVQGHETSKQEHRVGDKYCRFVWQTYIIEEFCRQGYKFSWHWFIVGKEKAQRNWVDRYHLLQSGGHWDATGTPNSPCFHILLPPSSCQPFSFLLHTILVFYPVTRENCTTAPGLEWSPQL